MYHRRLCSFTAIMPPHATPALLETHLNAMGKLISSISTGYTRVPFYGNVRRWHVLIGGSLERGC